MGKIIKKGEKGAAANYLSRNMAIKKLQISLAQFRRLCIIKGIYPREPRNKKKVNKGSTAPKTFYFKKDIQFLLHEPVLHKLREIRAHQKKINRAIGKREWVVAKGLEAARPTYRLDHIVKERYPSFNLAVRDLDDALSMLALFATLPTHSGVIKPSTIKECARLVSEFQHYVMIAGRLKKVFVSIKGIYYQADIGGSDVTWIVPHPFTQDTPRDVDFRIMATFLELYETLVGFINYKLYTDLNLVYPPKMRDETSDSGLAGFVVETVEGNNFLDALAAEDDAATEAAGVEGKNRKQRKEVQKRVKNLGAALDQITSSTQLGAEEEEEDVAEADEDEDADIPTAVVAPADASETVPSLLDAAKINAEASANSGANQKLFGNCVFFLSREVPRNSLEFVIKAFGGRVGWPATSGAGASVAETDGSVTHQIVDRPLGAGETRHSQREYVQPQWVYDCVNAGRLIKTKGYHVGEMLPAHLSPFGGGKEGYVPSEAALSALAVTKGLADADEEEDKDVVEGGIMQDEAESDEEGDDDDDDVEDDGEEELENKGPLDSDDDEAVYQAELEAEAAGLSFTEYMQKKDAEENGASKKKATTSHANLKKRKISAADAEAAEEKELAKMMMSKKERRLYGQIEFGRKKKEAEVQKLQERRMAHQKEEAKKTAEPKEFAKPAPAGKESKASTPKMKVASASDKTPVKALTTASATSAKKSGSASKKAKKA
ncbi:Pescadillo N-terminus-domain-containing protein [Chytriomyces sp. MP71]|nr:Pescadillo N-terminus-domain-containing protein [Chytriomyces sp. MP71]